jgi:hypothetical protein
MVTPNRDHVIGARIVRIGHSDYSEPRFVIEGIGPASFRSHYIELDNGYVLDLFTGYLAIASAFEIVIPGETEGIPVSNLIGRSISDVWRDDVYSTILILDKQLYLKDANDGVYGNPLRAGIVWEDYTDREQREFLDYWTETPIIRSP